VGGTYDKEGGLSVMTHQNLLVELFVEELPPKALKKLGEAFGALLVGGLKRRDYFLSDEPKYTVFASPRRLAVHAIDVLAIGKDVQLNTKLMPVGIAFGSDGKPSSALAKKIKSMYHEDVDVDDIIRTRCVRDGVGKAEALYERVLAAGHPLARGLFEALNDAVKELPIAKVMTYQLADGWSSVQFVRPAHGLVALHGSAVVPVSVLGLSAGNSTHGHRFEASVDPVVLKDADSYAATLRSNGAVIASFAERKAEIARQLAAAASKLGGGVTAIDDDALLDEVTALVERPNVLVCEFEKEFLGVPQECLILTMKANQKYFPLLDAAGKLTNKFLVVSNITPSDASLVIGGNERVVRPRLADAKFFFDQDRKKTLASRVEGLGKVVYHNKLGTQGERVERVRAIAKAIGQQLGGDALAQKADQAAQLAKTDLVTDMVGEFPELQGTMGRYYALNDGLSADVADAIEDHYKPRFAGDSLPRNEVGVVVALADKLETLVGMFGIGNLPTGDKDPFALRRHALGVIRLLVERDLPLGVADLVKVAVPVFGEKISGPLDSLVEFMYDRLAGSLREDGYTALEVEAVLVLKPQNLGAVGRRLAAVQSFAALSEAPALAAANKRIGNILKKTEGVDAHVSEVLLKEPAEIALYTAMKNTVPLADQQFEAGDYTASLQTLAALRAPVDAFFEGVMVNAEQMDLRLNRLGLLATLHAAMNRVADLSKLAS
jgi:glycyl-tRNA synthetase beta chain